MVNFEEFKKDLENLATKYCLYIPESELSFEINAPETVFLKGLDGSLFRVTGDRGYNINVTFKNR